MFGFLLLQMSVDVDTDCRGYRIYDAFTGGEKGFHNVVYYLPDSQQHDTCMKQQRSNFIQNAWRESVNVKPFSLNRIYTLYLFWSISSISDPTCDADLVSHRSFQDFL